MNCLITGINGFVGQYLLNYLLEQTDISNNITGVARTIKNEEKDYKGHKIKYIQLDLKNAEMVSNILSEIKPDFIIHLASESSVAYSWDNPVNSFQNNTNIFLNIVESVRLSKLKCRILSIGSSEEYGVVDQSSIPLSETQKLNPISPYAVARVSQEMLSKIYVEGYGLDIVMTRSFNHIGYGQRSNFVISSFAKQIVEMQRGSLQKVKVGNLEVVRDFLNVKDVVRAYFNLIEKGKTGELYNVCSGNGSSLREILIRMFQLTGIEMDYEIDENLIRKADNPLIIGCNKKIFADCGWSPEIELDQSLSELINYWAEK